MGKKKPKRCLLKCPKCQLLGHIGGPRCRRNWPAVTLRLCRTCGLHGHVGGPDCPGRMIVVRVLIENNGFDPSSVMWVACICCRISVNVNLKEFYLILCFVQVSSGEMMPPPSLDGESECPRKASVMDCCIEGLTLLSRCL